MSFSYFLQDLLLISAFGSEEDFLCCNCILVCVTVDSKLSFVMISI